MATGTLAGYTLTHCRASLPAWGIGYVDCTVDREVTLTGSATVQLADLSLVCSVVSGGPHQGRSYYRLCLGAHGWGRDIAAKSWANDAGVKVRTVLEDAAAAAGERFAAYPTGTVGLAWDRQEGPASTTLQLLYPEGWYVGEDGLTRVGKRASVVYSGTATRGAYDPARGTLELAAESIATLVPGIVVDGVEAVDVLHELTPDRLRTTIWGSTTTGTSRRLAAMRRMLEQLQPRAKYAGLWPYRVVSRTGERLNLQPERVSMGMPDIRNARIMPGVQGCKAETALGSIVLVAFVGTDPSRPVVVAFDDADSSGFDPARLYIGSGSDLVEIGGGTETPPPLNPVGRVLRYGDTIRLPPPINADYVLIPGTIPAGVARVKA